MATLLFDSDQHFTCAQCGRCCQRGWDIVITPAEAEAYAAARVAGVFRESDDVPEGAASDPFEPAAGGSALRIRKRADGACGFLSPENRCRIHELLGADRKPLTCRVFPFRFHPAEGTPLLAASFACPSVIANRGVPVASQLRPLKRLHAEWQSAWPEPTPALHYVAGRTLDPASAGVLRSVLREMLDRPGASGRPDLRANLARIAQTLEDLARHRVVRLPADAFAEYVELTGRHAARSQKPVPARAPSRLSRLLFRGFLLLAIAARLQREAGAASGLRIALRLRLLLLLAHLHGFGPAVAAADLAAARRSPVDVADPAIAPLCYHYLRSCIETLGTGRRSVLDELATSVALLNTACVLAAQQAGRQGLTTVDAATFTEGLLQASDLGHVEASSLVGRLMTTFAAGPEALFLFASGRPV